MIIKKSKHRDVVNLVCVLFGLPIPTSDSCSTYDILYLSHIKEIISVVFSPVNLPLYTVHLIYHCSFKLIMHAYTCNAYTLLMYNQ